MTSNHVIMSIKVRLDVANNKNIILCNFGSRIKRCFEVIEGAPEAPTGHRKQIKNPVWIGLMGFLPKKG